ncbi:MAG: DUF4012 domain-containing protein [Anaerolineales bacterium]
MDAFKRSPLRAGLTAIGLVIILLLSWQLAVTWRSAQQLRASVAELRSLSETPPTDWPIDQLSTTLSQATAASQQLRQRAAWAAPLTDRLGWLPGVGPTLSAGPALTEYTFQLTSAAQELFESARPLLTEARSAAFEAATLGPQLAQWTQDNQAALELARVRLERAQLARQEFELPQLPAELQAPIEQADQFLPLAIQALRAAPALGGLLGADGRSTFLLLAQNEDELRPTGGFISGVGTVAVEGGKVADLNIGDSYAVDDFSKAYPDPPQALLELMQAEQWLVRDANWSPDFPTSAADTIDLYELSTDQPVDGVIAFDQTLVAQLLTVLGPLELAGFDEPIDAGNVRQYMHEARDPEPGQTRSREWWLHRKDFMRSLGFAIIDQALQLEDGNQAVDLIKLVGQLLGEKHLLVYFEDPRAEAALASAGLDGSVRAGSGDDLWVIDSNVGFNKVDPRIDRQFSYQVDLRSPGSPVAALEMTYIHEVATPVPCEQGARYGAGGYAELQVRCYWDYIRVLVPASAELRSGQLPDIPADSLMSGRSGAQSWRSEAGPGGTTQFSGVLVLPTNDRAELSLRYSLPTSVLESRENGDLVYRLRWHKQPGTQAVPILVGVTPPTGFTVDPPDGWEVNGTDLLWHGSLRTDRTIELVFVALGNQ